MTPFTAPKIRRLAKASVFLAGLGLTAACTATATTPRPSSAGSLSCDIAVTQSGATVTYQGRVHANEAVSGTYSLRLTGPGTNIAQGGPFSARAGETVTIGQANLSGTPARTSAALTLSVNGSTYNCAATQ